MPTGVRAALVLVLIYLFLVGVSSLEAGIKIMGADTQERLDSLGGIVDIVRSLNNDSH